MTSASCTIREKLCAPATTLRTIVHFDLDQTGVRLLLIMHRVPLGCDRIDDEVTRFIGATKGDGQRTALFIHDPTRHILLLAAHIVITGSVVVVMKWTRPLCGAAAMSHNEFTIREPIEPQEASPMKHEMHVLGIDIGLCTSSLRLIPTT